MRAPEDAVSLPALGATTSLTRTFVAAVVVVASALTGYVGGLIWPLSTFSGLTMHLAVTGNTSTEPELKESAPLTSQVSKSAAATDPIPHQGLAAQLVHGRADLQVLAAVAEAERNVVVESELVGALPHDSHFDVSPQSSLADAARLPDPARFNVGGSSTGSLDASVAALHQSPAGQDRSDGHIPVTTTTGTSKSKGTPAARRWAPSAKPRAERGQGASEAAPSVVEFAPNPSPNQASRDFLARPSGH